MEGRFRTADSAITAAPTNNHIVAAVAQFVSELRDSHTNFLPPGHVAKVDYGYGTSFVGDTCFVTSVRAKSDAAAQGVKPGDALIKLDAFPVERSTYRTLTYVYGALSPRAQLHLTLRGVDGAQRTVDVKAKITMGERTTDYTDVETWRKIFDDAEGSEFVNHRTIGLGDSVTIWKMSSFAYPDRDNIDKVMKDVKKRRALILDLRNNGGGAIVTLEYMIAQFFDQDVTVGKQTTRKGEEPWVVKARTDEPFRGMLVVLVNSGSASSSELFSRVMQLEGRAIVVGDRSMGAVVGARVYPHLVGAGLEGRSLTYATQISTIDVVMSDGQRLENVGVVPDHVVLPQSTDIAARRDPQMAKALELVGVHSTPEMAGRLFRPKQTTD
jgi:C-terminal processing protease CtpA/Prc